MKKRIAIYMLTALLLTACGNNEVNDSIQVKNDVSAINQILYTEEKVPEVQTKENSSENTVHTEVSELIEEQEEYKEFYGILIDEDCSDFEDPPAHDLPCLLMDECRASGYGIDIQQKDGSWKFYPFDENGQEKSWEYLTHTEKMNNFYITVIGKLNDNIIEVKDFKE